MTTMKPAPPWYRHPEPWLLLIAPLVAVVGGVFTLWLAITTNNSLVVDDYYREGRAINQTFARDVEAARLGLAARWEVDIQRNVAQLGLTSRSADFVASEQIAVRLVHATESDLDHVVLLSRVASDRWEAPFAAPVRARWTLQIENPARSWRLLVSLTDPAAPIEIAAHPAAPGH
jgi:hypothetical protein